MSYIIKRNIQDQTIYRFDESNRKCQTISNSNSKTVAALTGDSAMVTINFVKNLLAINPSHWEDIDESTWLSISDSILAEIDLDLQEDSWNQDASFYFNLASKSCYRWSRTAQKYQVAGLRDLDKALIWKMEGPAAVAKIDSLESLTARNTLEWIPSNWSQFTISHVESVQFISPEIK